MIPAAIGPVAPKAVPLSPEEFDILYHTEHRAAGGVYCGAPKAMEALVAAGLMESAGRKPFVPDEYFCITAAGREALRTARRAVAS